MKTYLYDTEVIRALKPAVERLGLEIPADPNDPEFDEVLSKLSTDNPSLGAQLALARIESAEVSSARLLREQSETIEGKEGFADWFSRTFNKENINGGRVPNVQLMTIAGGVVAFVALGAFMFWPHSKTNKKVTTTSSTTQTQAPVPVNPNTGPTPSPTTELAPPPQGSTNASSTGSTVAPTNSQLNTPVPAYVPPQTDTGPSTAYGGSRGSSGAVSSYSPSSYSSTPVKPYTPSSTVSSGTSLPSVTPIPDATSSSPVAVASAPTPSASPPAGPVYTVPSYPTTYGDSNGNDSSVSGNPAQAAAPVVYDSKTPVVAASSGTAPNSSAPSTSYPTPSSRVNVLYGAASDDSAVNASSKNSHLTTLYASGTPSAQTSGGDLQASASTSGASGAIKADGRRMSVLYSGKVGAAAASGSAEGSNVSTASNQGKATMVLYSQAAQDSSGQGQQAQGGDKVLYSAAPVPAATPSSVPTPTPVGAAASNAAPFQVGQIIPGILSFSLDLPENYPMQVFVTTPSDQGTFVWKGTAIVDASKRLGINFTSLGLPSGQEVAIQAAAAAADGTVGLSGKYHLASPSAANDLVRGTFNGLQDAANAALQAGTTTISNGVTTVANTAPPVWMSILGGALNSFKLPSNTNSAITMVRVNQGTPIKILFGISSGAARQP
ncbi:hypothetical protein Dxin01_00769 [Deinococcus xinjiangensis]|uniref:Uncharacterized protein n=1 Tax=Deinococcus xinjiangensis TaxID=457454 RepID=A0ABP9VCK2_9DEIO